MGILRLREGQPCDLALSLSCGQAFRWEQRGEWWEGVVESEVWRLRQEGDRIEYAGPTARRVRDYLALDLDLPAIQAAVDRDPVIHAAIASCPGLRILRQDPWEILVSFICATNTHIPRIRQMIASLSRCFGERVPSPSGAWYSFPSPVALAVPCRETLEECRLGYRDRYIHGTAARIAGDPGLLPHLMALPLEEAREGLLSFPGVGPKAADCILLFGFHRYEAFPVDVWIRRIMHRHYLAPPPGMKAASEKEDRRIREFGREYFGEWAGYAQEYLFCARGELLGDAPGKGHRDGKSRE
ncbi:MAG: 8-oxoguanine DNA glycosylase [Methanomicrobiales archaeon]|nr:8-oxoguanine DNA glycosylase [Methanomicrobiales archaeon]